MKNHAVPVTSQTNIQVVKSSERLINLDEVEIQVGFKSSFIYSRIQKGQFPAPIKIGASSRWRESEIQAWIEKQIQGGE
jgi:prophage regulatory protein